MLPELQQKLTEILQDQSDGHTLEHCTARALLILNEAYKVALDEFRAEVLERMPKNNLDYLYQVQELKMIIDDAYNGLKK